MNGKVKGNPKTSDINDSFHSVKIFSYALISLLSMKEKDLSSLKSDIHLGLAASVNTTFSARR